MIAGILVLTLALLGPSAVAGHGGHVEERVGDARAAGHGPAAPEGAPPEGAPPEAAAPTPAAAGATGPRGVRGKPAADLDPEEDPCTACNRILGAVFDECAESACEQAGQSGDLCTQCLKFCSLNVGACPTDCPGKAVFETCLKQGRGRVIECRKANCPG